MSRDEARQLLAAIVESSDAAIISKDLNGIVTSWNKAAERVFGYTADEMIGRPIAILATPDRVSEMPLILERIRKGERVDQYETVRRAKDGRLLNIALTVSPIHNEAGEIVGASKIARDITDQKRMEEALIRSRNSSQGRTRISRSSHSSRLTTCRSRYVPSRPSVN
jgi:PAS domain S-box-containing protein